MNSENELYYLVSKELMDKLMGELGSYAYINNCFIEMNGLNQQLTSTPLIDLSDEAIEEKAIKKLKSKWQHIFIDGKLISKRPYPLQFWEQIDFYKQALTDIKSKLTNGKIKILKLL